MCRVKKWWAPHLALSSCLAAPRPEPQVTALAPQGCLKVIFHLEDDAP